VMKTRPGRKAVVLLSDGVDDDGRGKQLSKHSIDYVLRLARDVNVPLYSIGSETKSTKLSSQVSLKGPEPSIFWLRRPQT
jgi:hypothetical protein